MKNILILSMLLVAGFAQGVIETYQVGGLTADRNEGWNTADTPDGSGIQVFASVADPDLVFTITPVANNGDTIDPNGSHLAVDSVARTGETVSGRLNLDESITVTVSYVDPNGSLLALSLTEIAPYWGNNANEVTVFTDASLNSHSERAFDHNLGTVDYSTTGLDALTKDNTGTWSMTVSTDDTFGTTTSALGAFKLEYEVDTSGLLPSAVNDSYVLPYGVSMLTNDAPGVLANDVGDSVVLVDDTTNATLVLSSDGSFTYAANLGFEGTDTFTYSAVKGTNTSAVATVTLEVTLTPTANDDTYTLPLGATNLVVSAPGVLDNDVYVGTNTLFAQLDTGLPGLTFTTNNGSFSYDSPGPGTNSFTYLAYDMGSTSTVAATVTLITLPAPPPGTVITQTVSNLDWNDAMWYTPASAPSPLYDYITSTNGGIDSIRIGADQSASTFGGGSLTATSGIRFRIKARAGTSIVNGNLTIDGARVNLDSYKVGGTTKLQADQLIIASASTIDINDIALALELIAPLTGSGDLSVESAASGGAYAGQYVSFSEVSNYTGAITVSENMGIQFGSDITFTNGSLTILTNSVLIVNTNQTLTFGSGLLSDSVNGVVSNGTYAGASLDALGTNYVNNGGTLKVGYSPYNNTPSTSTGFEAVDADTIKWTISLPASADPSAYYPKSTDNLVISNWVGVAHSDTAGGTYAIQNLSVADASSTETNKIIYIKSTNSVEFLRVDVE